MDRHSIEVIKQDLLKLNLFSFQEIKKIIEVVSVHLYHNQEHAEDNHSENDYYLSMFITAKAVEGCSERTLSYYKQTILNMLKSIEKNLGSITTDDLRSYLDLYRKNDHVGKVTLDNIRRVLSSFFAWLEIEDHIVKSPVRRIHKIRTGEKVKDTYSDESVELMRDHCSNLRDLAIIDLLSSTGMRVGELVKLNRDDINFEKKECIVQGKGNKQRKVYFDAKTKIHLQKYIEQRSDQKQALFVSLLKPHNRLNISGVELRLRKIGKELNIIKVHPHKFRRTMATKAIDKGMPVEQVQLLLGHKSIDTTMQYALVNQNNVKESHRKFIC